MSGRNWRVAARTGRPASNSGSFVTARGLLEQHQDPPHWATIETYGGMLAHSAESRPLIPTDRDQAAWLGVTGPVE